MWNGRFLLFLACLPVSGQTRSFDQLVAKAVARSGLWEAPVALDAADPGFPEKVSGLILSIQTDVGESSETRAKLFLEYGRLGITPCAGWFPVIESGHIAIETCDLHIDAFIDADNRAVDGLLLLKTGTVAVKFGRLAVTPAADREFAGTWTASERDTLVVFRIGYSLGGIAWVTRDRIRRGPSEGSSARIGEFWQSHEHDHKLDAYSSNEAAFNHEGFTASTVVGGGEGLLVDQCSTGVGLSCPVTFHRVKD